MFLKNLNIEMYGESHSSEIGAKITGIKARYKINVLKLEQMLIKRNPTTFYNTKRKDSPCIYFKSGFNKIDNNTMETTGEELEFYLKNDNIKSKDYEKYIFRPGHADYVSFKKYGVDYPYKGGGPFSGRMTALIVIIGEIAKQILNIENFDFEVYYQVKKILEYKTRSILDENPVDLNILKQKLEIKSDEDFLCFSQQDHNKVIEILKDISQNSDSVGAEYEFKITGIKRNFGDIHFESFESLLSAALFSIPGLKGVNFGVGEKYYLQKGSELLEKIQVENNEIKCINNISGGINGGILNGYQDIYFSCIIKPPMSINKTMNLIKIKEGQYEVINKGITGRHDTFIGNKVAYVVEAWINILILDFYILEANNSSK